MRFTSVVLLLLFMTSPVTGASVTGTATYRERRIAMPRAARFEATLVDVQNHGNVVAETKIDDPGSPPIHFKIQYPASRIDKSRSYAVRAKVYVDGRLWMKTTDSYPVLTRGHGDDVDVLLRYVDSSERSQSRPVALDRVEWRLVKLNGRTVSITTNKMRPRLRFDRDDHRVSGSGGCNRVSGSYQRNGEQIRFSQMASTRMACFDGMETEAQFLRALEQTRSWRIVGDQLELFDFSRNSLATFEARERE
jgi:putative lipoprotein